MQKENDIRYIFRSTQINEVCQKNVKTGRMTAVSTTL